MIYIQSAFSQEEQRLELVGRQGKGGTRQLVFDCADVLAEYPDALIVCAMQRAGDHTAYLKDCATDGANRAVTLESADVAVPGVLKIELRALIGDDVRKSAVYIAKVAESLRGAQDRPGNPIADVLNRIDMTISRAEESIAEADAAAKSAREVADTVQRKLDNGDFVGPQGAPGSDASVTTENIQSALGYTPVKDVQVAGVSVLTEDVANVLMANKGVLGVSSVDNYSIGTTNTGTLFLYNSRKEDIDARSANIALTPYNLDYAVKAAMCDGKGAAWTATEQKAARERMGIPGEFELIEEITLSEDVMNVDREAFPDGTPYNLRSLIITIDSINVENRPEINGWVRLNAKLPSGEWTYIAPGKFVGTDALFSFFVYRVSSDGSVDSYFASAIDATPTAYTSTRSFIPSNVIRFGMHIRDFLLYSTDAAIPASTKISIYGVRA